MKRRNQLGILIAAVTVAAFLPATTSSALPSVPERIAAGTLKPAYIEVNGGSKRMPFLSGGRTGLLQSPTGVQARSQVPNGSGFAITSLGCANRNAGAASA